jgi:hypothetical protein
MKDCLERVESALEIKNGVKDVESLDYMALPVGGKELYNSSLSIGNINLIAGRFKTLKEGIELREKFLNIALP